jgi:hypothetical protein
MSTEHSSKNPVDPFDPQQLRLSQDFTAQLGGKKTLLTVPVRKPDRQWFIRVHPSHDWRLDTAVLHVKEDRETYLVEPALWPELAGELIPTTLLTSLTRQGALFLWPIRLPGADGRHDDWNRSALEAATIATRGWIRVAANLSMGAYEVFQPSVVVPEPEWPELGFRDLLKLAFRDRFISAFEHPVLRRLRGEL